MTARGAVLVAVLALAACSSGSKPVGQTTGPGARSSSPTTEPATTTTVAAPGIPWTRVHNPIYGDTDFATKDPALVAAGGDWVALFSRVDQHGSWRIGIARSRDLLTWSTETVMPHDPATQGEASPDVVKAPDGSFVVTYQSFVHDRAGGLAKLYARTTTDFRTFSAPIRLLANVHNAPADRLIDPAVAYSPAGLMLGYKVGTTDAGSVQHFEMARSTSGKLTGPWQIVGQPNIRVYGDTIENYQLFVVDGDQYLLATSNLLDRPELFRLTGNRSKASGWLTWSSARELQVPKEAWNTGTGVTGASYEHANCAFLVGADRQPDGWFYLVYADSSEVSAFGGSGHAKLALARSTDLVHWSVPPH